MLLSKGGRAERASGNRMLKSRMLERRLVKGGRGAGRAVNCAHVPPRVAAN